MKRPWLSLFMLATLLAGSVPPELFGQEQLLSAPPTSLKGRYTVRPLKDTSKLSLIRQQATTGSTIPMWNYSVVSPVDGLPYSGSMVGRSAFFHGHRGTTVPTYMVPVVLTFADTNTVFDPTVADSCLSNKTVLSVVQNSPVFQNAGYIMNGAAVGTTQYVDAFQRANFWSNVSTTGDSYHTLVSVITLPAIKVTVPKANGMTHTGFCRTLGEMDINWWDNLVTTSLIPSLAGQGVSPQNAPVFLFDSVVMYDAVPSQCCILGYHGAYIPSTLLQTYLVTDFDTSGAFGGDISVMTHEVGEWMDDPVGTNPTPLWGNIGQVVGCQNNLETGDPLSGTFFPSVTINGFTYHPQELAFFSWFYRQSPSIGAGGLYSNNATFTTGAGPVC